jgi:hypothetical protein
MEVGNKALPELVYEAVREEGVQRYKKFPFRSKPLSNQTAAPQLNLPRRLSRKEKSRGSLPKVSDSGHCRTQTISHSQAFADQDTKVDAVSNNLNRKVARGPASQPIVQ